MYQTLHARKHVVDMKNTLGGQFYFFQARRELKPGTHLHRNERKILTDERG